MLKFICYPKCTTCQRAKKWLDDNKIESSKTYQVEYTKKLDVMGLEDFLKL